MRTITAQARILRVFVAAAAAAAFAAAPATRVNASPNWIGKLDPILQHRVSVAGHSRVIVRAANPAARASVASAVPLLGGRLIRALDIIDGFSLDLPNAALGSLASNPLVDHVSFDRAIAGSMERTGATIGATDVRQELGVDGRGIRVAVIDSGVTSWHDDLADGAEPTQRVDRFVDFVNAQTAPYDDYGHGTHVAGIIGGNGYDSSGARSGIAPGVHLIVLKVLDGSGSGVISNVIAAFDYIVANNAALHVRVVNLSVAAGVYESYNADPLTLAAQRAVAAGIVVVAAAGNNGRGPLGTTQYAGVTAPGNAPWVLTVGASSHMGTIDRSDDTMAAFSSRGPGAIDYGAKPDLVAPGVGIESLSNPNSYMYSAFGPYLLSGTVPTSYLPYLSLSGTSMSTPVVSGTVALMLQANPSLTPNAVKAILQYTSQVYPGYDYLTEGAGFLNAKGAVELAAYLADPTTPYPSTTDWSTHLVWGNHVTNGGQLLSDANAWGLNVTWGASTTPGGQRIAWGVNADGTTWQTSCLDAACGTFDGDISLFQNVVWGALCGGADCPIAWSAGEVTATTDPEADTVVWGTDTESDTVVWGTSCADPSCQPVLWNKQ